MSDLDDQRIIDSIAKAMVAYDKENDEKSWRNLAEVAYNTMLRHVFYNYASRIVTERAYSGRQNTIFDNI